MHVPYPYRHTSRKHTYLEIFPPASIDYESVSQSLQFEPTDSTLSVTVEIRDDSIVETPERFTITITSLEVGVDIPFQQGTVLIEDDDSESRSQRLRVV